MTDKLFICAVCGTTFVVDHTGNTWHVDAATDEVDWELERDHGAWSHDDGRE